MPRIDVGALVRDHLRRDTALGPGPPLDGVLHLHQHLHQRLPGLVRRRDGARREAVARHYAGQGLLVGVDAVDDPGETAGRALAALRRHRRFHRT
ncbi:hypothetical protein [Kitasatospora sp. NPDC088134]|uniref:hypothetical protein n=1 Tax=Kitasatospora sp. NPDC088134 TaxID=3364071 RepID=UPI003824E86C